VRGVSPNAHPNRKEDPMKLSSPQVERALSQLEAQVIPENHPAVPQLNGLFGDHTFFVDGNGLNIVEPTGPGNSSAEAGKVIRVASWSDETHTSLAPHEPESTETVVILEPA
jgi:hypothetical protein